MRVRGTVVHRLFGKNSKSEHTAVYLETPSGDSYRLQRSGGNPFFDETLELLVGKTIEGSGTLRGKSLYLGSWKELK